MVVVKVSKQELLELTNIDTIEKLEKAFDSLGLEIKREDSDSLDLELYPDRPDLYMIEGIARAVRLYYLQAEPISYSVKDSSAELFVDKKVERVRPYIVMALVKNVKLNDQFLADLIDMQEKLHLTIGRKRAKVAIGLHDFDKIEGPFQYIATEPDSVTFQPLGMADALNLRDILTKHPKGIEYGPILKNSELYPVIMDSKKQILSFPPIINGTVTEITARTSSILIDVTGTDLNVLIYVLNLIITAFYDRGCEIYSMRVHYNWGDLILPNLKYEQFSVSKTLIFKVLGMKLSDSEILNSLKKLGYTANVTKTRVKLSIPPYRIDIMHEYDIIEDIIKGYGYDRIVSQLPKAYTKGSSDSVENLKSKYRKILTGLEFMEVSTLTLSSEKIQFEMFDIPETQRMQILNPVSEEHTMLRTWILPSLFETLSKNKHYELPQKLFEVGDVIVNNTQEQHIALAAVYAKAGFTDIKAYVDSIFSELGKDIEIESISLPFLIEGRAAKIIYKGQKIGMFGEVHPKILGRFELNNPVIVFESKLID